MKQLSIGTRDSFRIFVDSIRLYFEPIFGLRKQDHIIEKIYSIESRKRSASIEAFNFSREIASFNQGALIEYVFMLAESHKTLRLSLRSKETTETSITDLIQLMNDGFFESISKNFRYLHEHFEGRSRHSPRISVMGNWRTENKDKVITIYRDREAYYQNAFLLKESSALTYCARSGKNFLCNDIVAATLDGVYENPRISRSNVTNVISQRGFNSRYSALNKSWKDVWKTRSHDSSGEYRSTMVIPISIANDRLSDEVLEKFDAKDKKRMIFGYLCFDHVETNYFDQDVDTPIAKMVADILSIFAFQRLRFTDFSSTFQVAEDFLDGNLDRYELKSSISAILKTLDREGVAFTYEDQDEDQDEDNALLSADEILVKFLDKNEKELDVQD